MVLLLPLLLIVLTYDLVKVTGDRTVQPRLNRLLPAFRFKLCRSCVTSYLPQEGRSSPSLALFFFLRKARFRRTFRCLYTDYNDIKNIFLRLCLVLKQKKCLKIDCIINYIYMSSCVCVCYVLPHTHTHNTR